MNQSLFKKDVSRQNPQEENEVRIPGEPQEESKEGQKFKNENAEDEAHINVKIVQIAEQVRREERKEELKNWAENDQEIDELDDNTNFVLI